MKNADRVVQKLKWPPPLRSQSEGIAAAPFTARAVLAFDANHQLNILN